MNPKRHFKGQLNLVGITISHRIVNTLMMTVAATTTKRQMILQRKNLLRIGKLRNCASVHLKVKGSAIERKGIIKSAIKDNNKHNYNNL